MTVDVCVTPESAGWGYSGLYVIDLAPGAVHTRDTGPDEVLVVPLSGACRVESDAGSADLAGRDAVFDGPTDVAYLPIGTALELSTVDGGRFALCTARARRRLPFQYLPADAVPVLLRGAGACSRQVHNFAMPGVLDADRLIGCEVIQPGGNWSGYPPHKHDRDRPGQETALEEIYYFEVAGGGMAYQRAYASDERPIDLLEEVRTGAVVLIPYGWHGPTMAVPGYDLYYLNVMAGPGVRDWLIRDDPAHTWIRSTWTEQAVDPRLPYGRIRGEALR